MGSTKTLAGIFIVNNETLCVRKHAFEGEDYSRVHGDIFLRRLSLIGFYSYFASIKFAFIFVKVTLD